MYNDACVYGLYIHVSLLDAVPGSVIHCELVIAGMQEGLILTNLLCSIKHCDIPLPLHIEIYIQVSDRWIEGHVFILFVIFFKSLLLYVLMCLVSTLD